MKQEKYAEAEPLLLALYAGVEQRADRKDPDARDRLPQAADALVTLYTAWGKPAEAERWRAERARHTPEPAPAAQAGKP